MIDDKNIKAVFTEIDEDIQIDLEESILEKIALEKNQSIVIKRNRLIINLGKNLSIFLTLVLCFVFIKPLFSDVSISEENNPFSKSLPSLYVALTLTFLFLQFEVLKSSTKHNKK